MAKNDVGSWSATASNNTDVGGINIAEGCAAANLNNAAREIMAQIATLAPKGTTALDADYQAKDANLTSLAGLTLAANKGLYSTAADTVALFDLTAAGRALLGGADAAAQRTTLGLGTAATVDVIDEDDFATDSATRPSSQQSTKAYVDTEVAALSGSVIDLGALSGGSNTAAHSLAAAPKEVTWYLECTTAQGNYAIGDRIYEGAYQTDADQNGAFTVWADDTVVGFALSGNFIAPDKGAVLITITPASWSVHAVVKA